MELTTLRYYVEVAKQGNITVAAQRLGMTQPSLSRQMTLLEKEIGQKLFERRYHRIELTAAGIAFQKHATEILRLSKLAVSELGITEQNVKGVLSIMFSDGAFDGNIPDLINAFRQKYPDIHIDIYSGGLDYLNIMADKRIPDIVCSYYSKEPPVPDYVKTNRRKMVGLIMHKDDPLAQRREIPKEIYQTLKLVTPRGSAFDKIASYSSLDIPEENTIATVEEPIEFLGLIKRPGTYILCLEPSQETLRKQELSFRPIAPQLAMDYYFMQRPNSEPSKPMRCFMEYINRYYSL